MLYITLYPKVWRNTYISENALMPDYASTTFNINHWEQMKKIKSNFQSNLSFEDIQSLLPKHFCTFSDETLLFNSNTGLSHRWHRGCNIWFPFQRKQYMGFNYMAKDVHLVFYRESLKDWLHSYYLEKKIVDIDEQECFGGILQAGLVLDIELPKEAEQGKAYVKYEGPDGLLPNLDLLNSFFRIASVHGNIGLSSISYLLNNDVVGYFKGLFSILFSLGTRAIFYDSEHHGALLKYRIEAFTLGMMDSDRKNPNIDTRLYDLFPMIESLWRSVNNILERFHQSFFFYLLPDQLHYISISYYMPAVGLFILSQAIMSDISKHHTYDTLARFMLIAWIVTVSSYDFALVYICSPLFYITLLK
ncbi:Gaa1-like, GPI transamidase component domain-containing protein [Rozella allomycis CSF55]|uniref:Gaa1-like, GPI transamidase component domain-containing protein n=1 Tax=Rozella allomycis (strain CSF55) TaxID=988480 RepID=A0A075B003_ROZAC|nr:Gaa1-like, GPI transamidase component domain-containing protein [Rozella allomycis CSF55]|eukprot:EPZ35858.1 Gaa1-like, GPI transamidase component domain-containing protein [Rozella allomycis CSF55]